MDDKCFYGEYSALATNSIRNDMEIFNLKEKNNLTKKWICDIYFAIIRQMEALFFFVVSLLDAYIMWGKKNEKW